MGDSYYMILRLNVKLPSSRQCSIGEGRNRSMEQNGVEINIHKYSQLIFDKVQRQLNGGRILFFFNK